MQKINFQNLPNTTTPINETNLNSLQTNVEGAFSGTKGTSAVDTYNQQFLNGKIVNISNEVDEDYRVNVLHSKNLLDLKDGTYTSGVATAVVSNGEITLNTSSTTSSTIFLEIPLNQYVNAKVGYNYIISCNNSTTADVRFRTENSGGYDIYMDSANATKTFTYTSSNTWYITTGTTGSIILRIGSSVSLSNFKLKPMMQKGTEATSYEPYITPSIYVDNEEIYNQNMMNYSTSEQRIGTWIDGKPIYRKVIDLGSFPNNAEKQVAHNITNIDFISKVYIIGRLSNGLTIQLPYYDNSNTALSITTMATTSNVIIITKSDRSSYTGYATLEYTKTTD